MGLGLSGRTGARVDPAGRPDDTKGAPYSHVVQGTEARARKKGEATTEGARDARPAHPIPALSRWGPPEPQP
ncbi:hypothetical protein NDU88_002854 [Pleurodeles waltl]|uniref:Uncharacterized protein n=1 Tax=Pleurodeles waltl TaxID=8319 RepID=A0AAV7T3H5_PLEWA|nr:hypothetical protein NDU88_002854 [Pleurodeles waltl]